MKTFNKTAAQGEAYIRRIDSLPEGVEKVETQGAHHVIAHSETGHHHVMDRNKVEVYRPTTKDTSKATEILYLLVKEPTSLDHLRPHDTHESLLFTEGTYKVTLQQEYTPEGYRRVMD